MESSIYSLSEIGGKRSVEALIDVLGDDYTNYNSATIIWALGEIGDKRAVEPLIDALKGDYLAGSKDDGSIITSALGKIGGNRAVKALIDAIKDDRESVAYHAVKALGKIGGKPSVKALIDALENADKYNITKRRVVSSLDKQDWKPDKSVIGAIYWITKNEYDKCIEIGEPAVEPLIMVLNSLKRNKLYNAVEVLGKIGDVRAIEPLINVLKDDYIEVQKVVADALDRLNWSPDKSSAGVTYWNLKNEYDKCIEIGQPAVEPLIEILRHKAIWEDLNGITFSSFCRIYKNVRNYNECERIYDAQVSKLRQHAAVVLGKIGDTSAIQPLIKALKDDFIEVQKTAADALERLNWTPEKEDLAVSFWIAKNEYDKCIEIGELAVEPLIKILETTEWGSRGKFDDSIKIAELRQHAAEVLGKIGDTSAIQPLIKALKDDYIEVQKTAADALERLNWSPEKEDLAISYWVAKNEYNKCIKIGSPTLAVEALVPFLRKENPDRREKAIVSIIEIGSVAINQLISILENSNNKIEIYSVLEILGEIGDSRAVKPLITSIKADADKVWMLRLLTADCLKVTIETLIKLNWKPDKSIVGAYHWFFNNNTNTAISILDEIIPYSLSNFEHLNSKGTFYFNVKRYEKALKYYEEALKINPSDSVLQSSIRDTLQNLERYEEAANYQKKTRQGVSTDEVLDMLRN